MFHHELKEPRISIAEFIDRAAEALALAVISGGEVCETHFLDSPRVQKLGLALSGFVDRIHSGRMQIFGNSEAYYLSRLAAADTELAFSRLNADKIACILITAGIEVPLALKNFTLDNGIPLLRTRLPSSEAISAVASILDLALAPSVTTHGVLLDVLGVGVLLIGESGIGKSECALDLIGRGHRLIADDSVLLRRIGGRIFGEPPPLTRDHLEIRGLGIINARELFGVSALAPSTEIRLCIEFTAKPDDSGRLDFEPAKYSAFGSEIPKFVLPVTPGRNLATLTEAAVRVFVSRLSGDDTLDNLLERHNQEIGPKKDEGVKN
ncbi:MAG: HPr(Ser) kinase/phosphatase [Blastocatellia bacterium]